MKKIFFLTFFLMVLNIVFAGVCDYEEEPLIKCNTYNVSLNSIAEKTNNVSVICCLTSEQICKENKTLGFTVRGWSEQPGGRLLTHMHFPMQINTCQPFEAIFFSTPGWNNEYLEQNIGKTFDVPVQFTVFDVEGSFTQDIPGINYSLDQYVGVKINAIKEQNLTEDIKKQDTYEKPVDNTFLYILIISIIAVIIIIFLLLKYKTKKLK